MFEHAGRESSTTTPYFQLKDKYNPPPRAHFTLPAQRFSSTPSDREFQLVISSIREFSALSSAGSANASNATETRPPFSEPMSEPYSSDMGSSDINWDEPFDFDSFIDFSGQAYADETPEGKNRWGLSQTPDFGIEGGEDTVALTPAAEASELDSSLLNDYALKTPSIVQPAVPTLAPYSVDSQAPGASQYQLAVSSNICDCIVCAGVGKKAHLPLSSRLERPCRVPGCNVPGHEQILYWRLLRQEASHFRSPGEDKFKCAENDCTVTVSSMTDLKRHYTSKHCTKSERFPCRFVWCKYSGDNGFKRKDKLNSHYRNAHEGKRGRGKATRVTKPTSSASGSGSGGMGAGASGKNSTPPVSRT